MAANPNWWNLLWQYRLNITVDHTKVDSNQTDFPLLVNITEPHLSNALANGDDILLCKANNDDQLKHEIEYFNQSTGELVLWIKTDLSSSVDIIIYLYYGNVASPNQQDMNNTWKADYKMVQHLQETTGNRIDSTVNANDGTSSSVGVSAITGKIDGAVSFNRVGVFNFGHGASLDITGAITISAWVKNDYNPIPIYDVDDLQNMQNDLTASYILMNDIDATTTSGWNAGAGFVPIGSPSNIFTGILEGNNYTITNLFINRPTTDYVGLFGYTSSAEIRNLKTASSNITGQDYVGGLMGKGMYTSPTRIEIQNITLLGRDGVGGISGIGEDLYVCNSFVTGSVEGNDYIGGIQGKRVITTSRRRVSAYDCYSTCSVTGNDWVGGIFGEFRGHNRARGSMYRCYSIGLITGVGVNVGGMAGTCMSVNWGDSFWDTQTSAQPTSCAGTPKTTVEMKQQTTFSGFDFTEVWDITENVTYPWLRPYDVFVIFVTKGRDAYSLEMNTPGNAIIGYINNTELSVAVTPNIEMFVVMRYDGVNLKLFVNNVEVATTPLTGAINTNVTDLTSGNNLIGWIDEVRVSNEAKTNDWMSTSYDNQRLLAGFLAHQQKDALYFDFKMIDHNAIAAPGSTVYIRDNVETVVTEETTQSGGQINQQVLVNDFTPHTIKVYKYGKNMVPTILDIDKDLDWTFTFYEDLYITETNVTTVSGWTGITIDHTTETITISENHNIEEIYDYCQYNIIGNSQADLNQIMSTSDGINFTGQYDFIINDGITVSGTGKKFTMVTGKTYNLNTSGQFTGIVADQTKTRVPITISNVIAGSRIQIYNLDTSTELYNEIEATTEFLEYFEHTVDINARIRVMYVSGVNAYGWWVALGTIKDSSFSLNVSQKVNKPYEDNNIDGSTVTECVINGNKIDINVNDPDNILQVQRIYNWYQHYLFTEVGIRDSDDKIVARDSTHYTFDNDVQIVNLDTVNPLNLIGANIIPVSGLATNVFDLSNGASIALNFNRVEGFSYSSGSGLSPIEHDQLMATGLETTLGGIQVETDKINKILWKAN